MSTRFTLLKVPAIVLSLFILSTQHCKGQSVEASLQTLLKEYSSQKTGFNLRLKSVNLGRAIVSVPSQFNNKRTGTKDSDRGELSRPNLVIFYDIGRMSGVHISERNCSNCLYFTTGAYNGHKTNIALRKKGDKDELLITIWDRNYNTAFPANFWAEVKNKEDVRDMVTIVMNYLPLEKTINLH